jgi:GTP-binding protein
MKFIDEVKIFVKAGDGGNGAVSFRREKYVPKGGPDGGNGGRGGNVILRGDPQLNTLLDFKYRHEYRAEAGHKGMGKGMDGRAGKDLEIRVPLGCVVRIVDRKRKLVDITEKGQEYIIAQGGKGGRGNRNFATPRNQTPRFAEPGTEGEEKDIHLELKLLADVGLVGFPNAGKSTLISTISAARPKIADYPFTTLTPNLGMVRYKEGKSFVVADIPGIIEGAHEGKGLGYQFLKHIERTGVLVFLIDGMSEDPIADFEMLTHELESFSPKIAKKKKIVAITKSDLLQPDDVKARLTLKFGRGIKVFCISSVAGFFIPDLLDGIWSKLPRSKKER